MDPFESPEDDLVFDSALSLDLLVFESVLFFKYSVSVNFKDPMNKSEATDSFLRGLTDDSSVYFSVFDCIDKALALFKLDAARGDGG